MRSSDSAALPTVRSEFQIAVRLHWSVLFLAVSLGLLVGAMRELKKTPVYQASAWVAIFSDEGAWESPRDLPMLRPVSASPVRQVEAVLGSELFLRKALSDSPHRVDLSDAAALREVRSRLRVVPLDAAQPDAGFRLIASAPHSDEAAWIADRLASALVEREREEAAGARRAELQSLEERLSLSRERAQRLESELGERSEAEFSDDVDAYRAASVTPVLRQLRRDLVAENYLALSLEAKILAARTESGATRSSLEITRKADEMEATLLWHPWWSLAVGSLLGALSGIGLVRLLGVRRLGRTLTERFGAIPGLRMTVLLPLSEEESASPALLQGHRLEPYRTLRFQLGRLPASRCLSLAFHPTASGRSADEVLANLAPVLANGGHSTIIIEADPDYSRLHEAFDAGRHPGLSDFLSGEMRLEETVVRLPQPNLWLIPSGRPSDDFGELLAGKRMSDLLADLRNRFDYVLILSPSIRDRIEAALVCAKVDHVLAVADVHLDSPTKARRACEALEAYDCRVSGLLLAHRLDLSSSEIPMPAAVGLRGRARQPKAIQRNSAPESPESAIARR